MPDLGYYLGLVTPFHSDRPRFMWTLATLLRPLVDAQAMLERMVRDFDIDTAVGIQLDLIGLWLGRDRYISQPITNVFFSLDMPAQRVGLDEGVWLGPYDTTYGLEALDDETYRAVLKLVALANRWDGTLASIAPDLERVFPGIAIEDRQDMSMNVLIPASLVNSLLLEVLEQDFPIKPGGVLTRFIETTVLTEPIFGLDMTNAHIAGLDQAAWGEIVYVT